MNLLALHAFARHARADMVGKQLGAVRWFKPVLSIPLIGAGPRRTLVYVFEAPGPFVYLSDSNPIRDLPGNVQFPKLTGGTVANFIARPDDRVLDLVVDSVDGGSTRIILTFHAYGAFARALLRSGGVTMASLGDRHAAARAEEGEVSQSVISATVDDLTEETPGCDRTLAQSFGNPFDAGAVVDFRDQLIAGEATFRLVADRKLGAATPVPATSQVADTAKWAGQPTTSMTAAGLELGAIVCEQVLTKMVEAQLRPVERRLSAQRKLLTKLNRDLDASAEHDRVRREAETLAAFQAQIPKGAASVTFPDPYQEGSELDIELDPSQSITVQIEKRFKKATKLRKSQEHTSRRIELVSKEIAALKSALDNARALQTPAEQFAAVEDVINDYQIQVQRQPQTRTRSTRQQPKTFRTFDLGLGWTAIVGRNNNENDELTFKIASPGDTWLHAQHVAGSHVVLRGPAKNAQPPAHIVEVAAGIAAFYSKARHSEYAPVIYTLRKYVRKFRGALAGQVRCEREKVVIVAPTLPEGHDSEDS